MRVTVRLFARLREIAGTGDLEREMDEGADAGAVWARLTSEFPPMADYTPVISCAVNEEYARFERQVHDGDEVAFLPPVSGGAHAAAVRGSGCRIRDAGFGMRDSG